MKCNGGNIPINAEDIEDFLLGQVEAQGFHGDFELMVVDVAVLVEVEELELNKQIEHVRHQAAKRPIERFLLTASLISSLCSSLSSAISPRPASASLSRSARSARSRSKRCASRC